MWLAFCPSRRPGAGILSAPASAVASGARHKLLHKSAAKVLRVRRLERWCHRSRRGSHKRTALEATPTSRRWSRACARADPRRYEALHAAYAARPSTTSRCGSWTIPTRRRTSTQEVVIKVLRGLPRNDGEFTLPAWLYRVTVNAAFDHLRARKRRPVTVAEDGAPELACEVDEYERAELSRRVEATLNELPKRQQVALVLRDVHGLSVGETASVLGVTKGSADVLLSRARAGFRKVFLAGVGRRRPLRGGREDPRRRASAAASRPRTAPAGGAHAGRARTAGAPSPCGARRPSGSGCSCRRSRCRPSSVSARRWRPRRRPASRCRPVSARPPRRERRRPERPAPRPPPRPRRRRAPPCRRPPPRGGAGVLAALGSAAGVKIATLAAVATAAVGIAGVATHERAQQRAAPGVIAGRAGAGSRRREPAPARASPPGDHGRARLLAARPTGRRCRRRGRRRRRRRASGRRVRAGVAGTEERRRLRRPPDGHADGGAAGSAGAVERLRSRSDGSGAAAPSPAGRVRPRAARRAARSAAATGGSGSDGGRHGHTGSGSGSGTGGATPGVTRQRLRRAHAQRRA